MKERIAFNVPFYRGQRDVCWLWPASVLWGKKKTYEGVRFGFSHGVLLSDPSGFLQRGDRKQVHWRDVQEFTRTDERMLAQLLAQAVRINEERAMGLRSVGLRMTSRRIRPGSNRSSFAASFDSITSPHMRSIIAATLCSLAIDIAAQPTLLPAINTGVLPSDADPICALPAQTPPITSCGRPEGEQAADFTLFDLNGDAFDLEDALLQGKPVLMISSSYTCPVFRNKVPKINQLVATHGAQLHIIIVYTPEAHPYLDPSPYFGAVNTGQQNIDAGILYQQPATYGERKAVLQDMLDSLQIDAPVYLDGPCNEWWDYYGPQPNNAYLIDLNGTIHTHHDWFDKLPEDIDCDIEDLLALPPSGDCGGQTFGGAINVQWVSNDTVYGTGGTTITAHLKLFNTSATEDVLVRAVKLQTNLPAGWQTSLCLDVCYLPDMDTAIVPIPAGDTLHFYYYFYSTPGDAIGFTRLGMRNEYNTANNFVREVWGVSSGSVGVEEPATAPPLMIAPNPAADRLTVMGEAVAQARLLGLDGREFNPPLSANVIDLSDVADGIYVLYVRTLDGAWREQRLVVAK